MQDPTIDDQDPTRKSNEPSRPSYSRETNYVPIDQADWIEPPKNLNEVPEKIAEFEIRKLIGRGGFGAVYEAYDTILQRQVAIKIPHRSPKIGANDSGPDLREARAIASLDHPHIVPVYQASSAPGVPLYIVVRLIPGRTLGQWAGEVQPSFSQIAEVIASIADALGYAHARSVVHRDVKPSNILVDNEGRAYIADFGLALREFDLDVGPAYVGTPAFMSPEQARGEGHRVDGRSDIFSLGVVLYELLTGTRPFSGTQTSKLLNQIKSVEPEHPCRLNPAVPTELARVCLHALNKSLSGRYQRAEEMSLELREYCRASINSGQASQSREVGGVPNSESASLPTADISPQPSSSPVVPRGLRAFEASDADFFLRLLPGPYDRHGLPSALRFWKSRLESRSSTEAFSVGVVYGPSGCGKTSLFRAGLLPRLSPDLDVLYIQATAQDTEKTLQTSLNSFLAQSVAGQTAEHSTGQKSIGPESSGADYSADDIVRTFAKIRRQGGRKVVICIDQFEQWLYGHSLDVDDAPLTQALRHCDGVNLQCVLMVRDDFWMGISRLMQALDIPISEHQNACSVDLFDKQHARRVLGMFGVALGKLSHNEGKWTAREQQFLTSAINYLAIDGRVICVQLALLAEMMKHREWDNAALFNQDGGAGIGLSFFEQTFESDSAPRRYRSHCEGAQRLLRKLLPEPGTKIKGAIQSESELRENVDYADMNAFKELLRILDAELHLITPTTKYEIDNYLTKGKRLSVAAEHETGYQLTHDFLITPLRKWLAMRRLTTRLGQAQTRLEEYTELYRARPIPQSLPTLFEYLQMRRYLNLHSLTEPQLRMMKAAGRYFTVKATAWSVGLATAILLLVAGQQSLERSHRQGLERSAADTLVIAALPEALQRIEQFLPDQTQLWTTIAKHFRDEKASPGCRLRAALALISPNSKHSSKNVTKVNTSSQDSRGSIDEHGLTDAELRSFLLTQYLDSSAPDAVVLCQSSLVRRTLLHEELAKRYQTGGDSSAAVQLRLAGLLVQDPKFRPVLLEDPQRLVKLLVAENPLHLNDWVDVFRPIGFDLLPSLEAALLVRPEDGGLETVNLANLISEYAVKQPTLIASLIAKVGPTAHALLVNAVDKVPDALDAVRAELQSLDNIKHDYWNVRRTGTDWWNDAARVPQTLSTSSEEIGKLLELSSSQAALVDSHFILLHRVSRDQLLSIEKSLDPLGYRVASISPLRAGDMETATVLWKRDGRKSKWLWPATASQLNDENAVLQTKGHFIADLAEYSNDDFQTNRFACVWTDSAPLPGVTASGMYLDVPADEHESAGWGWFTANRYVPKIDIQSADRTGKEYFTSLRWKLSEFFDSHDNWNDTDERDADAFNRSRPEDLLVDAHRANRDPRAKCGLTHVWWSGMPLDSTWTDYHSSEKHLERCAELQMQGYRPFGVHARTTAEGRPEYSSVWWRPHMHVVSYAELARQQSRLILALHKRGIHQPLQQGLGSQEADIRGALVEACAQYKADGNFLLEQIRNASNSLSVRRASLHALSLMPRDLIANDVISQLTTMWPKLVSDETDPGMRSALEALHRAWALPVPPPKFATVAGKEMQTRDGTRLVVLEPPPVMIMGSPAGEPGRNGRDEQRTAIRMPRSFAISVTEVTAEEYLKFAPEHEYAHDYCSTPDSPIIDITWFDAVRYCRWLSQEERMEESDMCYPPLSQIGPGMKLDTNYLNRKGYRLPTEAEWEFAARGGFAEARHFGFLPDLLDRHAWTAANSNFRGYPVGRKLPNDYGLFDMFGNAMEMCQNPKVIDLPKEGTHSDPAESHLVIVNKDNMASRGGAILFQPLDARAAHRDDHPAGAPRPYLSFRIVRTVSSRGTGPTQ